MRGIRGAISVEEDTREAILEAAGLLLQEMVAANKVQVEDVCSILFTMTPDLHAVFPAEAARKLNWVHVPLVCAQEVEVHGALGRCIRVLMHWNTTLKPDKIRHVYLRKAESLRPDLKKGSAGG